MRVFRQVSRQAVRPGFFALVAVFSLSLAACIESRKLLFDEAAAVTPAPEGRYRQQQYKYGRWEEGDAGTLTIENRRYRWKPEGEDNAQFFSVYDVGNGFYIAAERNRDPAPDDPYLYGLFEVTKDGVFLAYLPNCSDIMNLRLPEADVPVVDGSDCVYADREALVRSLRRYAEVMLPSSRFVPLK